MAKNSKSAFITAKTLTKSNVWKLSENDVFTILGTASKEIDLDTQLGKLLQTIKMAFELENLDANKGMSQTALESRGFKIGDVEISSTNKMHIAVKKRGVSRITDLSYQNVQHITAQKLLELIEKNFGGGWDSLSQSVKDVILSGFLIASTSMPKSRNFESSALYMKKMREGFEVLAVEKGSWVELIFAKQKETIVEEEKVQDEEADLRARLKMALASVDGEEDGENYDEEERDDYNTDEEEDDYNEDELMAESYRTVVDEDPDDLDVESIEEEDEVY